jgi:eukaryotic-like serine/threonine-protein kinase
MQTPPPIPPPTRSPVTSCLECGAEIPSDAKGLCPKCLLKLGLASGPKSDSGGSSGSGVDRVDPSRQLEAGPFEFGEYRILRLLGRGGMGAVYEAEDLSSGRRVALKVLGHSLDSPETRKRFLREGRLAASINHPNSVYVYGTEEIEGAPVITMELLPGGTLHDRVKAEGPLPIAEAVDAILQVIAGLEAAHAVGILHRDIKPSNCFFEPGGTVKVGDFGLSISTLSRGDSALTIAGSVLGTPEFSSPEQLRGEELNVRSDIYSVGVTLYYLLTGKTPFQAENLVQLLASVLDKTAVSPRDLRPEIPEPLAQIVLRCLEKQAGDRFKNYDELRRALLPFNSTAPTPATLGLRFVAAVVDHALITGMNMLLPLIFLGDVLSFSAGAQPDMTPWLWAWVALTILGLAYFAVPEGIWGASLGKALVGLRVAGLNRCAPGIPKALLRALIYLLPAVVQGSITIIVDDAWASEPWHRGMALVNVLYTLLLFSTARRRNGFAGLHDLCTQTRVIQKSAYQPRMPVAQEAEPIAATEEMPKVGPYHVLATMMANESEELLIGYDTKLLRRVWIRRVPVTGPPVPAEVTNIARPGRLRWLQGQRTETEAWDAYEYVAGVPLLHLLRVKQPWSSVRHWLLDLGEELRAAALDGSMPETLAMDRVWVSAAGRAKLLHFRPAGVKTTDPIATADPDAVPLFLKQIAISALEGKLASKETARTREPGVPLPLPARSYLREILDDTVQSAIEGLRRLVHEIPAVSRRRRLGLVAGCVVPAIAFSAMMLVGLSVLGRWQRQNPQVSSLMTCLELHANQMRGTGVVFGPKARGAMEIYIAGQFGDFIRNPQTWNSPFASAIPAKQRAEAEKMVAAHPNPTPEEMKAAQKELDVILDENGKFKYGPATAAFESGFRGAMPYIAAGGVLIWAAGFSLLCAIAFRGGALLRLLGIAVVTRTGADASRLRVLWRAILAWAPCVIGGIGVSFLIPIVPTATAIGIVATVVAALVIWSAALPDRSLQDRLAGTWLVPK